MRTSPRRTRALVLVLAPVVALALAACEPTALTRPARGAKGTPIDATDPTIGTQPVTTGPTTTAPATTATTTPATTVTTAPSTTAPTTTTAPVTTTTRPPTTTTRPPTTTTSPPPAGTAKPRVPATGAYFGLWLNPIDASTTEATKAAWTQREQGVGRTFDIAQSYYPFSTTFPTWRETWHIQNGRTPLISWNGTTSSAVVAGQYDDLIRARARAVKALGVPVFLRYFWEPDAKKKVDIAQSYDAYKANWRHVHDIWAQEGVTNAAWVWCPTAWGFKTGEAQKYYPGDDVVDWMCADGYNWGPAKGPTTWNDWNDIYQPFNAFGTAHKKPMMAGEYGSVERDAGEKEAWFSTIRTQIKAMPGIKAVVYFDSKRMENSVWMDWRTDSSASAWKGFVAMGHDPYFNP